MIEIKPVKTKADTEIIEIMGKELHVDSRITKEKVCSDIKYDGYKYYTAFANGEACGYCTICGYEFDHSILLRKLYVKKGYTKKSIADEFIKFFINEHAGQHYKVVWFYVNKKNVDDIETYKQLGFVYIEDEFESEELKMAYKIREGF